MNWTVKKKEKFCKFISKLRIISLRHSSILRQIWLNFMALCLVFIRRLFQFSHFLFRISNFFDLSITEETWVVEMRIWCIKFVNVLLLHWIDLNFHHARYVCTKFDCNRLVGSGENIFFFNINICKYGFPYCDPSWSLGTMMWTILNLHYIRKLSCKYDLFWF
jgi:hypothetical protein